LLLLKGAVLLTAGGAGAHSVSLESFQPRSWKFQMWHSSLLMGTQKLFGDSRKKSKRYRHHEAQMRRAKV